MRLNTTPSLRVTTMYGHASGAVPIFLVGAQDVTAAWDGQHALALDLKQPVVKLGDLGQQAKRWQPLHIVWIAITVEVTGRGFNRHHRHALLIARSIYRHRKHRNDVPRARRSPDSSPFSNASTDTPKNSANATTFTNRGSARPSS